MSIKKRLLAMVSAAAMFMSVAPISSAAEENTIAINPKWIPTTFDEAMEFENTYGTTHIEDGKLDVFDLCLMKRALISMKNEAPPPFDENKNFFHEMLGIAVDETYDNISAVSMESLYRKDAEELVCELKNANLGKGFYYFPIPFLEKYENGSWKQLYNADPAIDYQYGDGYVLCGLADNVTDKAFSTRVKIQTKNLTPGLTEGHYRFKIYTAKNILYAEFDVA